MKTPATFGLLFLLLVCASHSAEAREPAAVQSASPRQSQVHGSEIDWPTTLEEYESLTTNMEVRGEPLTAGTVELYRELSDIYLQARQFAASIEAIDQYVDGIEAVYPGDIDRQTSARLQRARVFAAAGEEQSAALAYSRAQSEIEKSAGRSSLILLPVLLESAEFMRTHEIRDGLDGVDVSRRLLRRAVHIAEKNTATTNRQLAETYFALADHYIASGVAPKKAAKRYAAAWETLGTSDADMALREQWFSGTVPLLAAQNIPRAIENLQQPSTSPKNLSLEAVFSVDEEGRAINIELTDNTASDELSSAMLQFIKAIRFRPSLVDGRPALTDGHQYALAYAADQLRDGRG